MTEGNDEVKLVGFGGVAESLHVVVDQPSKRENAMIRKFVLLLAAISFGSVALTACNTIQGAGRDMERAGEKVQQEAQEHKRY